MLKGKIIQISYQENGFYLKIDQTQKFFEDPESMDHYLSHILEHVKNPYKTKLLKQDLQNYFR